MPKATSTTNRADWRALPARQQPTYRNSKLVAAVVCELQERAPLVPVAEIKRLRRKLAKVAEGKAFILQAGDCAEMFNTPLSRLTNLIKVMLQMTIILMYGGRMEIVKLVRGAGQYAKPRSSDIDELDLKSYRGDLVNHNRPTKRARRHDPRRMLRAYNASAKTLAKIRELTTGGMADLRRIHQWNLDFVQSSAPGHRFQELADNVEHFLDFMEACGVNVRGMSALKVAEMFVSHEGLVLEYEDALVRDDYATSGHFVWIGERTRHLLEAHVDFFRHLRNPVGVKIGPKTTIEEIKAYCRILNPQNTPGKLVFISRMGASEVRTKLSPLMRAAQETSCPVIWICDPMHGNTFSHNGYKTRSMDVIKNEIEGFFEVCAELGVHPGGVHLELTGDDVTECLGGHTDEVTAERLKHQYETACDPRLNGSQALEVAFFVAGLLQRLHRGEFAIAA
jgi:3-deoxy-7-phosphoheptulonate synthase